MSKNDFPVDVWFIVLPGVGEADDFGVGVAEAAVLLVRGSSVGCDRVVFAPIDQQLAPNNAATAIPINLCRLIFASILNFVKFADNLVCRVHVVFHVFVVFDERYLRTNLSINVAGSLTQFPLTTKPFLTKINALSGTE